jgi:hypothetical protein
MKTTTKTQGRGRKRAKLSGEVLKGDPAGYIIGKPEEQPAKRHGEPLPKPARNANGILADVRYRMQELEPLVAEYKKLDHALKAIEGI